MVGGDMASMGDMVCTVRYQIVDGNARILERGRELQKSDAVLAYAIDEESDVMIWSEIDYQLGLWMEYNDIVTPPTWRIHSDRGAGCDVYTEWRKV